MNVGFVGLGNMGFPMAENLVKAGFSVKGFNRSSRAMERFGACGGTVASDARDAASDVEAVITMLPSGETVKDVCLGDGGILAAAAPNTLFIDCSTIAAADAMELAAAAGERGHAMLDAPVSGGVGGAKAGTLTFIVGGDDGALERAMPLLQAMGKNVFHVGGVGAGQTAKICNNMLLAILMIGTSEALKLGVLHGLDPRVLSDVMKQSSGNNWALQKHNPYPGVMEGVPASRDYEGGFESSLMLKDLALSQDAAAAVSAETPLGRLATELYRSHSKAGSGSKDFSSIIQRLATPDKG